MAPPTGQFRPGRYLGVFAAIVAVLYLLVFFTGDGKPTPKLGIDLQGGTRVTLTAESPDGKPPSQESLNQAKAIIDQRVNGLGVSGTEVVLNGNTLVLTAPGDKGEQIKKLGQTAKLVFRPVVQEVAAASQAPPTQPGQPPKSGQPAAPPSAPASVAPKSGAPKPQGMPAPQVGSPDAADQPIGVAAQAAAATTAAKAPVTKAAAVKTPAAKTPAASPATPTAPPSSVQPTPSGQPSNNGSTTDEEQKAIEAAKALRQNADPQIQQLALAQLDCNAPDPLRGFDDPTKPLVTCDQKKVAKFILAPSILDGSQIADATSGQSSNGPGYVVRLQFKSDGEKIWGQFTSQNVGKQSAFVLDGEVVSAPTINGAIYGTTEISGNFGLAEAQDLSNVLKYGSLPLKFVQSESETVSSTLGIASLQAGLIAGAIGLLLVFIYSLFYYRLLGILTILSLGLSGLLVYGLLVLLGRWIGLTLDLAGIAGFIIAIGITADSFIIFFERLKDEIREGRTFRSAVPRAWVRARRTILSADAVSFLASAVLYALSVGQVKGFAFTLGMSTVLDLLVVFLVTHPLVSIVSNNKTLSTPGLSGLGSVMRIGAAQRAAAKRRTAAAAAKEA